jgi:bile acid-coenzyme A ligase
VLTDRSVTDLTSQPVTFGRRLSQIATTSPDASAVILVRSNGEESLVSWAGLDDRSNQVARLLAQRGASAGAFVLIALPNSIEHIVVAYAAWKLGACALPLNPALPAAERDPIVSIVREAYPVVIVGDWPDVKDAIALDGLALSHELSAKPLPDVLSRPGKAMASGGSTGRPKVIINESAWQAVPGSVVAAFGDSMGMRQGQLTLIPGSLYGNTFFEFTHWALFEANPVVLMEKFNAEQAWSLIERHRVQYAVFVPTMMRRMLAVADLASRNLSSLEAISHTSAPCPPSIKRAWIDLLGGERIYEGYGATEGFGTTTIRGDDWLHHPGSVGRPTRYSEVRVVDADGRPLPPRAVGEVYLRRTDLRTPPSRYLGVLPPRTGLEGFASVGDLGWLDDAGYLYIADRRTDLIISGGTNVYPAEVEAVLSEHAGVADVAVIGLPDEDWGRRVHAVIQPRDPQAPPSTDSLTNHCRARLQPAKLPKSYEFVATLPRDGVGKIRRSALVEARS